MNMALIIQKIHITLVIIIGSWNNFDSSFIMNHLNVDKITFLPLQDPEFYEYLKEHDKELLEFDDEVRVKYKLL